MFRALAFRRTTVFSRPHPAARPHPTRGGGISRATHAPFPPQVVHQLLFLTALSRSKAVDSEAMTVKN
jgi:hypothetical protein